MASSDDEFEDQPEFVSDYQFVDENDEPISFSVLPIQWSSDRILGGKNNQVFVRGTTDGGLQKMYKPVLAWRFDLSPMNPKISVLSKDNHWITLQKPKKSFECIIRTSLVTVNCLHLVKKNPEMSDKLLWSQLSKIFSLLEPRPSVNDLIDHMQLIEVACRRDKSLSKSKFITTILEERPQKKKVVEEDGPHQSMKWFIVDDDDDVASDDDSDGDQLFDSVCAICDNGGRITPCDGMCMRSFHTSPEDADKDAEEDGLESVSRCDSLGYSKKEIQDKAIFTCKNCIHKQHQCFSCGSLGSSDKISGNAEVFQCVSATCGYFFHPWCVAKLLHPDDQAAVEVLSKSVAAGKSFACPSHNCDVCKQLEDHKVAEMQFAVCRRCPTSYHRKCLPREISFEASEDTEQRAWENLLHINNRILIYCLKHEIDPDLGTPIRDHLKFPGEAGKKAKTSSSRLVENIKLKSGKRSVVPESKKLKQVGPGGLTGKSSKLVQGGRIDEKNSPRSTVLSKRKGDGVDASSSKERVKKKKTVNFSLGEKEKSIGMQLWEESRKTVKTVPEQSVCLELEDDLGPDSKKWLEDLIKKADSAITSESIYEKSNKQLSTHAVSQKALLESFTQGRVDGLVQAIHAALEKLQAKCDVKDIQAVCAPSVLPQISKWKNKLRVYIAPFLHGNRYTSFGRHFTKPDKLKEIVDKIHWYVEDGDTVVDFCCGANEFSCLMKDKLEQTGKKCSYKNFDLFRPKNDFCFERRDWMTVKPSELPRGSKLVMGLNPPFGVNSVLANQFINQALKFKPKLIVLIVPPEAERLDRKKPPYDLVWEDFEKLSGLSFYLPGSIDVNDKQIEDWNVVPPVLYLWSRSDWTSKFRGIAEKHGHTSGKQSPIERNHETVVPIESMEVIAEASDMDISDDIQEPVQVKKLEGIIENAGNSTKDCMEQSLKRNAGNNTKDCMEQSLKRKTDEEIHAVNGGVSSECTKKSQEKQHLTKHLTGKGELGKDHQRIDRPSAQRKTGHPPAGGKSGKDEVGDDHQMHERPITKPYYTKTNHSPARAVALSRSPPESQLHVKGRSPLARETTNIGSDQFKGPGFSRPGYRNRPEYRPGSRSPLKDQLPLARDGFSRPSYQHRTGHRQGSSNSPADGILFIEEPGFTRSANQPRPGYSPGPRSYPEERYNGWPTGGGRHPLDQGQGYMEDTFGQQPLNREMGSWYNIPPPNFGLGHASMSAMERYAPRLDELNNGRMGNVGPPDVQLRPGHSGMYNHQAPRPPYGGFAPGPRPPTSHQRSGGWLYE